MSERWRPVPGYEGSYEVSDAGRVRSLDRVVMRSDGRRRRFEGRLLSPGVLRSGHLVVGLHRRGAQETMCVHRLVLLAFVGPPAPGRIACHNDGDASNNALSNLRWDTHKNNTADMRRHDTMVRGESSPNAILTSSQVAEIRRLYHEGHSQPTLAHAFGVSRTNISAIVTRRSWKHIA